MGMLAIKGLYSHQYGWAPVAVAATKTSSAIDMANLVNNMICILPGLWTDGTHVFSVTDSPDNTTYTAVTSTNIVGSLPTITGTAGAVESQFSYIGPNRYLKVIDTVTTGTTGMVCGVSAFGKPRKQLG